MRRGKLPKWTINSQTMQPLKIAVVAVLLPAFLLGCAATPSVSDVTEISIWLYDEAESQLIIHGGRRANNDMSAGRGAATGATTGFSECAQFEDSLTSAFFGALCGAVGAVVGAGVGAALGDGGDSPAAGLAPVPVISVKKIWHQKLQQKLEAAAVRNGKTVVPYPDGDTLHVVAGEFFWEVRSERKIAMMTTVLVAVGENGRFDTRQFSLVGPHYSMEEWQADDGARVAAEVDSFANRISDKVWQIVD